LTTVHSVLALKMQEYVSVKKCENMYFLLYIHKILMLSPLTLLLTHLVYADWMKNVLMPV